MVDIVERLREEAGRDDLAYRTVTVLMDAATAIEQQRAKITKADYLLTQGAPTLALEALQ